MRAAAEEPAGEGEGTRCGLGDEEGDVEEGEGGDGAGGGERGGDAGYLDEIFERHCELLFVLVL